MQVFFAEGKSGEIQTLQNVCMMFVNYFIVL